MGSTRGGRLLPAMTHAEARAPGEGRGQQARARPCFRKSSARSKFEDGDQPASPQLQPRSTRTASGVARRHATCPSAAAASPEEPATAAKRRHRGVAMAPEVAIDMNREGGEEHEERMRGSDERIGRCGAAVASRPRAALAHKIDGPLPLRVRRRLSGSRFQSTSRRDMVATRGEPSPDGGAGANGSTNGTSRWP
ncbi:hypothetical protein ZWY2020_052587 [Hordeum vulgare]|nr:hypothetical protein ZWY2020_052587 [Hordeum vulgare]